MVSFGYVLHSVVRRIKREYRNKLPILTNLMLINTITTSNFLITYVHPRLLSMNNELYFINIAFLIKHSNYQININVPGLYFILMIGHALVAVTL